MDTPLLLPRKMHELQVKLIEDFVKYNTTTSIIASWGFLKNKVYFGCGDIMELIGSTENYGPLSVEASKRAHEIYRSIQ